MISDNINLIKKTWIFFSAKRKIQFLLLIALMVVSAFAEAISMGAVLPFISVLTSPEKLYSYTLITDFLKIFNISENEDLILFVTIIFILSAIIAGFVRILLLWASSRFAVVTGTDISYQLYKNMLMQPYAIHISRNSSQLIGSVISKVDLSIYGVLIPFTNLISGSILLAAILTTLLYVNFKITLFLIVIFSICYFFVTFYARERLKNNSLKIANSYTGVLKALQEGLGGFRDVLLDQTQEVYFKIFREADYPLRRSHGDNIFIGGAPRYLLELVGIILISFLAFGLSFKDGGLTEALPTLGILALAAQRLLPALQGLYSSWASILGSKESFNEVINIIHQPILKNYYSEKLKKLEFTKSINLKDISFAYNNSNNMVLKNINLSIPKGSCVGVIGTTGSGKSTFMDILIGLLSPTKGKFYIDDKLIKGKFIYSWQRKIAHVPQKIFLTDGTISENIAFGIERDKIDLIKVKSSARIAHIDSFIEASKDGYNSLVGERGIKLSGGQSQRIGIARALYKNSSVLFLDEATSALDSATEQKVIDSIHNLDNNLTIIMIAHRLTTLKACDFIIKFDEGKIVKFCKYDDLIG